MLDLAETLSKLKNAIVIAAGSEKRWGIIGFDYASEFILQALHNYAVPILSGEPLCKDMKKGRW